MWHMYLSSVAEIPSSHSLHTIIAFSEAWKELSGIILSFEVVVKKAFKLFSIDRFTPIFTQVWDSCSLSCPDCDDFHFYQTITQLSDPNCVGWVTRVLCMFCLYTRTWCRYRGLLKVVCTVRILHIDHCCLLIKDVWGIYSTVLYKIISCMEGNSAHSGQNRFHTSQFDT